MPKRPGRASDSKLRLTGDESGVFRGWCWWERRWVQHTWLWSRVPFAPSLPPPHVRREQKCLQQHSGVPHSVMRGPAHAPTRVLLHAPCPMPWSTCITRIRRAQPPCPLVACRAFSPDVCLRLCRVCVCACVTAVTRALYGWRRAVCWSSLVAAGLGVIQAAFAVAVAAGTSVPLVQNAFFTQALPALILLTAALFFTVYASIIFLV
jgi:hypothetical protein